MMRLFGSVGAALAYACVAAAASGAAPNPTADIPLGPLPGVCSSAGPGATCERAVVRALDRARRRMGLSTYKLPAGFTGLAAGHQWLILANLDRIAYSLPPIAGTAAVLDRVARQGAAAHTDPNPWPLLTALHGQARIGFGSNWAGGQPNALIAYYYWVYDDGYGSGNVDCPSPTAPGCWGHRRNILGFPHAQALTMGAAALGRLSSYALTIVETSTPVWPYAYRWRG